MLPATEVQLLLRWLLSPLMLISGVLQQVWIVLIWLAAEVEQATVPYVTVLPAAVLRMTALLWRMVW